MVKVIRTVNKEIGQGGHNPSINTLESVARSVVQWQKRSPIKRIVWGSIPRLATKWVTLVTLNMCGWDNMSLVA